MKKAQNKWPITPSGRGGLFLPQSLREMLDQSSYESFRVPTLNVVSRSYELITLCEQVRNEKIPPRALQAPLDEFVWSLDADPVAKGIIPQEVMHFPQAIKAMNVQNPADVQHIYRSAQVVAARLISGYRETLIHELLDNYIKDRKDYIRKLLHSYCSLLIFHGWDERFLLNQVEARFFQKDIGKFEKRTLERFFRSFDRKTKIYRVWIPVSKQTYEYFRSLKFDFFQSKKINDLPNLVKAEFENGETDFPLDFFIESQVERLDHFSGAAVTFELLELLTSLSSIQKIHIPLSWDRMAYTIQNTAKTGLFVPEKEIQFQEDRKSSVRASAKKHKRQASTIISRLESATSSRTLQALKNVTLAQSSTKPENQLVLIWSAIENLLSDPPTGVARIEAYTAAMTPCVCLNYARQYMCAVHDELQSSHPHVLKKALKAVPAKSATDTHTLFAWLVFNPDYEESLKTLFADISSNPLATNRLWKLKENFSTPKTYLSSLESHEKRVRWQLSRIYRARNDLVHGGESPRYLAPLVLNAFEYFKSTFFTVIYRAERSSIGSEMDYLIASVIFDYGRVKAQLSKMKNSQGSFDLDEFLIHFAKR
ncbi:MAG: hypothetical protein WA936_03855 [Erythrobacter sp.]